MSTQTRVREIKKRRLWWIVLLILVPGVLYAGYITQYKPRVEAKNYASYAMIVLTGIEFKITNFKTADEEMRMKIINSLPSLWDKFCELECPDDDRSVEIQWKMAKIFDYSKRFMHTGEENILYDAEERITDLERLIDDTIAYGNFKRL